MSRNRLLRRAALVALGLFLLCRPNDDPLAPWPEVRPWLDALRGADPADTSPASPFVRFAQDTGPVAFAIVPARRVVLAAPRGAPPVPPDPLAAIVPGVGALTAAGVRIEAAPPPGAPPGPSPAPPADGVLVLFPRDDGSPPEAWPAGVLTRDVVVRFRPGVLPSAPELRSAAAAGALAAGGVTGVSVLAGQTFDPATAILRVQGDDPLGWLAAAAAVRALPSCDGLAHPDLLLPYVLDQGTETAPAPEYAPGDEWRAPESDLPPPGARPSDPLFDRQWHLHDTPRGTGAAAVWATRGRTGDGVVVAVIDPQGVQRGHHDLADRETDLHRATYGVTFEFTDRRGERRTFESFATLDPVWGWRVAAMRAAGPSDEPGASAPGLPEGSADHSHGTSVAGIVLASRNGEGVCGIAPGARLLPVYVSDLRANTFAASIRFAADAGADVLCMSMGYPPGVPVPQVVREQLTRAAAAGRDGRGCVVVCSLTNERVDNFGGGGTPNLCATDGALAVGRSTDRAEWGRSGFGWGMSLLGPSDPAFSTATGRDWTVLGAAGAPRLCIATTDTYGPAPEMRGRNAWNLGGSMRGGRHHNPETADDRATVCFEGTSAAAPMVAGTAALVLSADPGLSAGQVRDVLEGTARPLDDALDETGAPLTDFDRLRLRGHGIVDARAAVAAVEADVVCAPSAAAAPQSGSPAERREVWTLVNRGTGVARGVEVRLYAAGRAAGAPPLFTWTAGDLPGAPSPPAAPSPPSEFTVPVPPGVSLVAEVTWENAAPPPETPPPPETLPPVPPDTPGSGQSPR